MKIRTLQQSERERWLDLLEGWDLRADGWHGREFFRRWIDDDPTYADENVWVAVDGIDLISTVQIFPRQIRVLGHSVPTGGIGSVFTRVDRRSSGAAGAVLERATEAMTERGLVKQLFSLANTRTYFLAR